MSKYKHRFIRVVSIPNRHGHIYDDKKHRILCGTRTSFRRTPDTRINRSDCHNCLRSKLLDFSQTEGYAD